MSPIVCKTLLPVRVSPTSCRTRPSLTTVWPHRPLFSSSSSSHSHWKINRKGRAWRPTRSCFKSSAIMSLLNAVFLAFRSQLKCHLLREAWLNITSKAIIALYFIFIALTKTLSLLSASPNQNISPRKGRTSSVLFPANLRAKYTVGTQYIYTE